MFSFYFPLAMLLLTVTKCLSGTNDASSQDRRLLSLKFGKKSCTCSLELKVNITRRLQNLLLCRSLPVIFIALFI